MKIKFIPKGQDFSGYSSLHALATVKGFLSPCGNYAVIPDNYIVLTNGEWWNVEKCDK